MFWFFNRNCADKNRLAFFVGGLDFFNDCIPLVFFVEINFVLLVYAGNRKVCWNCNNVEFVNLWKFNSFCLSCTCHTRELVVHAEEILEGDSCHSAVALGDFYVLFCLDCLVQTVRISSSFENTSCKFVYNLNLTVFYNIVNVVLVEKVCAKRLCKVV